MTSFLNYYSKKRKNLDLKIFTFGKNKKANVCVKKIIKWVILQKYSLTDKEKTNFIIKDLNIYNVLSSIAVLKVLGLFFDKLNQNLKKFFGSVEGRVKNIIFQDIKKI